MNPLNWTAAPFLTFYVDIACLVCLAAWLARRNIGESARAHPKLITPELAYLAGGEQRVGDAVITGLLTSEAATLSSDGRTIEVDGAKLGMQPDLVPFAQLGLSGQMKRREFQARMGRGVEALRKKLDQLGLCPGPSLLPAYRLKILALFSVPLLLGIAKVQIGMERHKPVGFLIILLIVTAIATLYFLTGPRLTRAGHDVLAAAQVQHARAARAPLENELMLAVALAGLVVLSGTSFDALYAASRSDAAGGGGCGGGGGGGGGGCGGCGG
jgi:uncharacterized protein (TIGR04222 family)